MAKRFLMLLGPVFAGVFQEYPDLRSFLTSNRKFEATFGVQ